MVFVCLHEGGTSVALVSECSEPSKGLLRWLKCPHFFLEIKKKLFHVVSELNSLLKVFEKQWQNNFASNKTENGEREVN